MSKSTAERVSGHALGLLDPPDQIKKTIMRAVTDSGSSVNFEAKLAAGVDNLLTVYEVLSGTTRDDSQRVFDGVGYGKLKTMVVEAVNDRLSRLQAQYHQIIDDRTYLSKLLRQGSERAQATAQPKLTQAYEAVGIKRP